jgi:hypothetical protein
VWAVWALSSNNVRQWLLGKRNFEFIDQMEAAGCSRFLMLTHHTNVSLTGERGA